MTTREDVEYLIERLHTRVVVTRNSDSLCQDAADALTELLACAKQLEKTRAEEYAIALELRRKLAAERNRMREALVEITEHTALPLEKVEGVSLDVTGAKVLYSAWSHVLAIARAALLPQQPATGGKREAGDDPC